MKVFYCFIFCLSPPRCPNRHPSVGLWIADWQIWLTRVFCEDSDMAVSLRCSPIVVPGFYRP